MVLVPWISFFKFDNPGFMFLFIYVYTLINKQMLMLLVQFRRVIITRPKSVVLTLSPVIPVSSFNWERWSRTGEDAIYYWNQVNVSYPWQYSNTCSTQPCLYYYIYFVRKVCWNRKWVQLLRCSSELRCEFSFYVVIFAVRSYDVSRDKQVMCVPPLPNISLTPSTYQDPLLSVSSTPLPSKDFTCRVINGWKFIAERDS